MGKVAYINRCILMDNLHIPSSGLTMPPEGIVVSEDVNISQVGCPGQTLRNEGALAV